MSNSSESRSPLVSVIIPNFNYARYLPQTIGSVLSQSYKNVEVIVVDNGSTDHSLEVLKNFGSQIQVIAQENRGQAGARNRGIEECNGEFIAFLDADDFWLPSKLEKQMQVFKSKPEVGAVYCGVIRADGNLNPLRTILPEKRGDILEEFVHMAGAVVQGGESTAIFRRECFLKAGVFDTKLSISTGWDMFRRIAAYFPFDYVAEGLVKYRMHGQNAHQNLDVFEKDILMRLEKMFSDRSCERVYSFKNEAYGRSYLAISGSYLHSRRILKAIKYLWKSVATWPESFFYVVGLPWRFLARHWKT